jgi:exonuclease VII large subunit
MRGFDRDLLITLQKEVGSFATNTPVVASQRTKRFLKDGASSLPAEDPWHNGADPWAMHRPTTLPAPSSAAPARRLEQLQAHIREEVKQQVSHAPPGLDQMHADPTIQQLQVNITELQAQGAQFQAWFSEAGQRMTTTEQQLQHLHAVVEQQGQHVSQQIDQIQQEVDNKTQILQHSLQGSLAAMQRDFDASLDTKLSNRFDRIESMLAKKSRTEA